MFLVHDLGFSGLWSFLAILKEEYFAFLLSVQMGIFYQMILVAKEMFFPQPQGVMGKSWEDHKKQEVTICSGSV